MRTTLMSVLVVVLGVAVVVGQNTPAAKPGADTRFEVASVKRNYLPPTGSTHSDRMDAGALLCDERDLQSDRQTRLRPRKRCPAHWRPRLDQQRTFQYRSDGPGIDHW